MNWKSLTKSLRDHLRPFRVNISILTGRERSSGEDLVIFYAGSKYNKSYFARKAFRDNYREEERGKAWLWVAIRLCRNANAIYPMSVLEINKKPYRLLRNGAGYYIPCWIDSELEFSDSEWNLRHSVNVKNDVHRIRKNGLHFEITKEKQMFDLFYHHMYLPHITRVHADAAVPISYEQLVNRIDHCELLLVKKDDEYIAGDVLVYENDEVRAWCNGVKDGNQDYVKLGALAAVYYFRLMYLQDKGYKKMRLGASRAFLNDGVLQYKRKWGMHLTQDRNAGFWLLPLRETNGVREFLINNPFIYESNDEWYGAMFFRESKAITENEALRLRKTYHIPGIKDIVFHSLGEPEG